MNNLPMSQTMLQIPFTLRQERRILTNYGLLSPCQIIRILLYVSIEYLLQVAMIIRKHSLIQRVTIRYMDSFAHPRKGNKT